MLSAVRERCCLSWLLPSPGNAKSDLVQLIPIRNATLLKRISNPLVPKGISPFLRPNPPLDFIQPNTPISPPGMNDYNFSTQNQHPKLSPELTMGTIPHLKQLRPQKRKRKCGLWTPCRSAVTLPPARRPPKGLL